MAPRKKATADSFANFEASLGLGTNNIASSATYIPLLVTKNQVKLEAMYRSSWIIGNIVDVIADDMTQGGIEIQSQQDPKEVGLLYDGMEDLDIWHVINSCIKWSRLYGSCILVLIIDGQKLDSPLRMETIGKDQFRGCITLDRWQLIPNQLDFITELGPDFGMPEYYEVRDYTQFAGIGRIHHSRVIRMDGIDLPWNQKRVEQFWGESVIERIYDRVVAFDSTTQGIAQLVYKAYLRTWKVKDLRNIISSNANAMRAVTRNIEMIRKLQTNEGITIMDAEDEFDVHSYSFAGLDDVLLQFSQQLSGASEIPLVRLLGQSPAGMNATGESDLRSYYDGIHKKQETRLRKPIKKILEVLHRSIFGSELPDGFRFKFNSLWQMSVKEKADIAKTTVEAVTGALNAGLISPAAAMMELRQSSEVTGIFSNIDDAMIAAADEEPPKSENTAQETDNEEPV